MKDLFELIFGVLASPFKSRAKLEAKILVPRQQINVLRRRAHASGHPISDVREVVRAPCSMNLYQWCQSPVCDLWSSASALCCSKSPRSLAFMGPS